jgi:hypothetical protein
MPFIVDDSFYDGIGGSLPDCSVAFLNRAGHWSARNSESGFVPAWALARFSDDPGQAVQPLFSAGIAERAKKGGIRILEGNGITIVNARDVVRQAEAEEADLARKREQGRVRAQRKRDKDKAARLAAMTEGVTRYENAAPGKQQAASADVTQESRAKEVGVTRYEPDGRKKPQVKHKSVTRYEAGSSRVTPPIETDRSNQDQSVGVAQVNAGAREHPAVVASVVAKLREKTARDDVGESEALHTMQVIRKRAEEAGKVIRSPRYFLTAIDNEVDLYAEMLPPPPQAAQWTALADAPEGAHPFNPDTRSGVSGVCLDCPMGEHNRIHLPRLQLKEVS